jgi:hypothetical protein
VAYRQIQGAPLITIKKDSELQHVLAHLWNAVNYAAKGQPEAAEYELDSIAGLIFFDSDEEFVGFTRGDDNGEKKAEPMQEPEPMPEEKAPEE